MRDEMDGASQHQVFGSNGFPNQPAEGEPFDFWHYWRVIVHRRWIVVGVFVIIMAIVGIREYRTPPIYKATGTLAIEPAQQRVVVVLRLWQGLSYREIADTVGRTEATVRSHMHHGLIGLRKYLEPRLH